MDPIDPFELPRNAEEAERSSRQFSLEEVAALTGVWRQQLQRWVQSGAIDVFEREGGRHKAWITGPQVAEIWRHPTAPNYVRPRSLTDARRKYGAAARANQT
jgi:hypothetical protein